MPRSIVLFFGHATGNVADFATRDSSSLAANSAATTRSVVQLSDRKGGDLEWLNGEEGLIVLSSFDAAPV
jgi:hypothetical protein